MDEQDEQQEGRQEVINRNLPKLIGHLLGIDPAKAQNNVLFNKWLESAKRELQEDHNVSTYPESVEENVTRNMNHFLERYKTERLHEFGVTFDKLASLMLKHPSYIDHKDMNFKWRIMDFMLSVNFEAFRNIRRNRDEMERQRKLILKKIEEIVSSSMSEDTESEKETTVGDEDCEICSLHLSNDDNNNNNDNNNSSRSISSWREFYLTRLSVSAPYLYISQSEQSDDMIKSLSSSQRIVVPWSFNFFKEYADYLESRPCLTESRVLYEYISMFFAPQNWIHFQVINGKIHFRKTLNCFLPNYDILEPLKHMQMLQKLIYTYTRPRTFIQDDFSTMTCLFEAIHRMLKPVMEFLIYSGECVTKKYDDETQSIQGFWKKAVKPFQRLQLMSTVCQDCYSSSPTMAEYERSYRAIAKLYAIAKQRSLSMVKSGAAALLLCSLKAYCQFMANMYRAGEFEDYHAEFIAEQVMGMSDGISAYKMRSMQGIEDLMENCEIYHVIEKHIRNSAGAVSFLFDHRKTCALTAIHKDLLARTSLYDAVIELFLQHLKVYQMSIRNEVIFPAPTILEQVQDVDDESMRRLLLIYQMQLDTATNDMNPNPRFTSDKLWLHFESCHRYAPVDEILTNCLDHVLTQRTVLVNSYCLDVVRCDLHLLEHTRNLHSVYLLLEYDLFSNQFHKFFASSAGVQGLKPLVAAIGNPEMAHHFVMDLPFRNIATLRLDYQCNVEMNRIITKKQLQALNGFFRISLQIREAIWKLEQLPVLFTHHSGIRLVRTLTDLRCLMMQTLRNYETYLDNLRKVHQAMARNCDQQMAKATSFEKLVKCHEHFVKSVTDNIVMGIGYRCDLQVLFGLVDVLKGLWGNLRGLYRSRIMKFNGNEFDLLYDFEANSYIQSLLQMAMTIHCSLVTFKADIIFEISPPPQHPH